ncbi:MAG TPA: ABC transporter permease [Gemmatimonadaceae bacterium]|jgi:lipopolysaccharide transport system permease protein|nr:ABC transporter permease [Gemmatimonadaceae bacterium]
MTTAAAPVPRPAVALEQQQGVSWLREILQHRDLFFFFVWRDVKIRYKQTFLGALWAVIQPLATALILTVFVGHVAAVSNTGGPYAVFSYSALVPWTFFSTTVAAAAASMTSNANLLTKIYFPRIAIPATPVLAGLVDFAVASSLLVVVIPLYGLSFSPRLLLWPVLAIPMCVLCLGLGIVFSCWTARYRDMKYALPFAIQLLLFATPIIYPVSAIPQRYQWLVALNPLTGLVQAFRACVLTNAAFDGRLLAISIVESVAIFVVSLVYLRRTERVVADYV